VSEANVIIVVPIPRYVVGKCCDSTDHITNYDDPDYVDEVMKYVKIIPSAVSGILSLGKARTLSLPRAIANDSADPGGSDLWFCHDSWSDPVHLSSQLYSRAAGSILALHGELTTQEPAHKRARLESVAPPPTTHRGGRGGRSVRLPGWVLGRGPTGSAHARGSYRPRGHGPSHRGPSRGTYGRYGYGNRSWHRGRGRG
jgi:hypothetical protein